MKSSRKRVFKRKLTSKESVFAFVNDITEDASLSVEEKLNVLQETLIQMKIDIDTTILYPDWIQKSETKTLLTILNIEPSGTFRFNDAYDKDQFQFRQVFYELLELNSKDFLEEMFELIAKHWTLLKQYNFPNKRSVMTLIVAIQKLIDQKDNCLDRGEVLLTGLYNAIFHHIYQMNGYEVKG